MALAMTNGLKDGSKQAATCGIWERHTFSFVNFERMKNRTNI
jgi:hypothetical protein